MNNMLSSSRRGFQYRDDANIGLRQCQTWQPLEHSPHNRLVFILFVDGMYQIHLFDLDLKRFGINISNEGFPIRPNMCIPFGLGVLRFCCVGSILYVFQVNSGYKSDVDGVQVSKIELSQRRVSSLTDHMLDVEDKEGMLEKVANGLSYKSSCIPLRWGRKIFLFSSQIIFEDRLKYSGRGQIKDFEIFCPVKNECIPLPPLLVRPSRKGSYINFQFFNGHASKWESFRISPLRSSYSSSEFYFKIDSYGLDHNTLLLQAEFGTTFCLDLDRGRDAQWQLLTRPVFMNTGQTFFVDDDNEEMWVDACGITVGQERQHIKYRPLSSPFSGWGFTLLNDQSPPFIVRLGLDTPLAEVGYEVAGELRWCIETLIVVSSRCEEGESEDEGEGGNVNLKMVPRSSWKFMLKDQDVIRAGIEDVFSTYY